MCRCLCPTLCINIGQCFLSVSIIRGSLHLPKLLTAELNVSEWKRKFKVSRVPRFELDFFERKLNTFFNNEFPVPLKVSMPVFKQLQFFRFLCLSPSDYGNYWAQQRQGNKTRRKGCPRVAACSTLTGHYRWDQSKYSRLLLYQAPWDQAKVAVISGWL